MDNLEKNQNTPLQTDLLNPHPFPSETILVKKHGFWFYFLLILGLLIISLIITFSLLVKDNLQKIKTGELTSFEKDNIANNVQKTPTYSGVQKELIEGFGNYSIGSTNPKITIVQFSDFACPYCKNSFPILHSLVEKYPDIKIIFRDRPAHEYSLNLAMAAQCAGEQNKFWPMHDLLFNNQSDTLGQNATVVINLAKKINIDETKFLTCLKQEKYLKIIQKNFSDSETLKATGTPTWFINGEKISGDFPETVWDELLKKLLNL